MALNVGSRLGHYNVTALIGEGGMGQVYRCTMDIEQEEKRWLVQKLKQCVSSARQQAGGIGAD